MEVIITRKATKDITRKEKRARKDTKRGLRATFTKVTRKRYKEGYFEN